MKRKEERKEEESGREEGLSIGRVAAKRIRDSIWSFSLVQALESA